MLLLNSISLRIKSIRNAIVGKNHSPSVHPSIHSPIQPPPRKHALSKALQKPHGEQTWMPCPALVVFSASQELASRAHDPHHAHSPGCSRAGFLGEPGVQWSSGIISGDAVWTPLFQLSQRLYTNMTSCMKSCSPWNEESDVCFLGCGWYTFPKG